MVKKKDKKYINVPRPEIIRAYNKDMSGVDLLDRVIAKYGMRSRTKKWTVRTIHHFMNFTNAATWIEYRQEALENGFPKKDTFSYYLFKLDIADNLTPFQSEDRQISGESNVEQDEEEARFETRKQRRTPKPLPSVQERTHSALHLPQMRDTKQKHISKCRNKGCGGLTLFSVVAYL